MSGTGTGSTRVTRTPIGDGLANVNDVHDGSRRKSKAKRNLASRVPAGGGASVLKVLDREPPPQCRPAGKRAGERPRRTLIARIALDPLLPLDTGRPRR